MEKKKSYYNYAPVKTVYTGLSPFSSHLIVLVTGLGLCA